MPNPVLTASGTSGHGAELGRYIELASLGAVVVKSLSAEPWAGNPAPRVHEARAGMLNSVGLQNPGVEAWLDRELPDLEAAGARVVASIWGLSPDAFARAATLLAHAPPCVLAVEVNLSCPNTERRVFAHSAQAVAEVVAATAPAGRPRWAKLSGDVADVPAIADAAVRSGADALVLVNTARGMAIDVERRRPVLGAGPGGLSGPAVHPIAVRAVYECHAAAPDTPIIGVGGVSTGVDAIELVLAGASAVEVGTASFADPRASVRVLEELRRWCERHDVTPRELIGGAHG